MTSDDELVIPLQGALVVVDPDCVPGDPGLDDVENRLRDDLVRFRLALEARRQEKATLAEQIRLLVAAVEVVEQALRPFDRKRKS